MRATLSLVLSSILSIGSALFVQLVSVLPFTKGSFYTGIHGVYVGAFLVTGFVLSVTGGLLACDRRSNWGWIWGTLAFVLTAVFTSWIVSVRLG